MKHPPPRHPIPPPAACWRAWLLVAAIAATALPAMPQGEGLRAPASSPQGESVTVEVATNDATIEVSTGPNDSTSYPVPPDKRVVIPPTGAAGTILTITAGRGARRRIVLVEITPPQP